MNILIIAAHPDDEILGCGGIINRFRREGHKVETIIMDGGRIDIKKDQYFDDYPIKDWITKIELAIEKFEPNIVFTHFLGDLNRDHQVIAEATQVACRPHTDVKEIFSYETAGSAGISISPFRPDTYFVLEAEDIEYKTQEMEEKYSKELRPFPHPRSILGIETLASSRGMEVHSAFAEAFMTIRRKL